MTENKNRPPKSIRGRITNNPRYHLNFAKPTAKPHEATNIASSL